MSARLTTPTRPTLYVNGRFLHDRSGAPVILRGVNLALLDDWRFPGADWLADVAQTGANAVRLQWYVDYGNADRPPYTLADLDGVLTRCKVAGMIPIVQLADLTCNADASLLGSRLIPWWTSAEVVAMLDAHADYLIINLANELGSVHWADDGAQGLQDYVAAYTSGLAAIRAAGLAMPVMIDAPDGGASLDVFATVGRQLVAADPAGNLLLSTHAYWAEVDDTGTIATCIGLDLPLVFGEIANREDDTDADGKLLGYFDLAGPSAGIAAPSGFRYQALLRELKAHEIGWLAWGWCDDDCLPRRLSSDGPFAHLTPYGHDLVHNATYGLLTTAVRVAG